MLAAFYSAIKAVNQSLLNDLCFLTCFTGGGGTGTVAAALRTHGSALRAEAAYATDISRGCLDYEHTVSMTRLLRGQRVGGCAEEKKKKKLRTKPEGFRQRVVFQLTMYSCRVVFATAFNSHKFGSTGYI